MLAAYQAFNEQITSEYLQAHSGNSNTEILNGTVEASYICLLYTSPSPRDS